MSRWPTRIAPLLAPLLAGVLLVACSGSDSDSGAGDPAATRGTAITVEATKVPAKDLVQDLRAIAANPQLARLLKQDDTKLVPQPDTIDETVSQAWVTTRVDQILADHVFEQRGLKVTAADRAAARQSMTSVFRGKKVFDAFPAAFQRRLIERQAPTEALKATFPATHEPAEAELRTLYTQVEQTCEDDRLFAQIVVGSKAEADQVVADLAAGADYATLAKERSIDSSSSDIGGVITCIGAPRFKGAAEAVQAAARNTPIGSTSAPVKSFGNYAVLKALPLTFENARALMTADWHTQHPTPFFDFLKAERAAAAANIAVAKRFAQVIPTSTTIVIQPPVAPVRL